MAITYSPFHMGMNFRIKFSLLQGKSAPPLAEECRLYQRLCAPQGSRGRGSAGTGAQPIRTAASSNAWEAQEHWWEEKGGPGNTETVFIPFEVVCVCVSERERELSGVGVLIISFPRSHMRRRVKTYLTQGERRRKSVQSTPVYKGTRKWTLRTGSRTCQRVCIQPPLLYRSPDQWHLGKPIHLP